MGGQIQKRPTAGGPGAGRERIEQGTRAHYTPAGRLLPLLDGVRRTGPGRWTSLCPAHYDRNPSLSLRELDDGTLLIRCWVGCGAADVVAAVGLTLADLFPRRYERSMLRRGERWVPRDVLACLRREALIVAIAAEAVRRGEVLSDQDTKRLALAVGRLRSAAEEVSHE